MNNRVLSLLAGLVLVLGLALGGSAMAGPATGPALSFPHAIATADYCADPEEQAFLSFINDYRAQNGLGPLALTQTLGAAAKHHSIDMAENDYFSHTLSDGTSWEQNIRDHGYTFNTFLGENIAAGNAEAGATFTQWQNSPPHNANMLSANFNAIGIGRAFDSGSTFGWYWTTTFGGVVDGVANLCGEPAPGPSDPPADEPPSVPEVPEVLEEPEVPEVPDAPEVPEEPDAPEVPQVPEAPEVPELPETPEVPEVPVLEDLGLEWDPRFAFVDVNPRLGLTGETIEVTGRGFAPGEVQIAWGLNGPILAVAEADDNGSFSTAITVPESAQSGRHQIVVSDTSGTVKNTPFVVLRSWSGT